MDRLREMAAERIEWLVELVLGEGSAGLDLGTWLGGLGAVDELAGAMASGMPAAVRVASPPGGAARGSADAYDAGDLGGVGDSGGQASSFAGGTGHSSAFSAARDAAWGSAGEFLTLGDDYNPNFPPYAEGEGYLTTHDCTLEVYAPGILENDWDPDGGDIYPVLVTGPSHADYFDLESDGSFTYTPVGGFFGEDGFTYRVSDGVNLSEETATCTIGVMNFPPVSEDDPDYLTTHDCPMEISDETGVLANDFDADGDPMTAVLETGPAHAAAFSLNSGGGFYYEPEFHWVGTDTFTYHATDGLEDGNVATVTIGVMNMPPVAWDDGPYDTDATTSLEVDAPGVLENDWDYDGDYPLTAVLDTGPSHGTLDYFHSDGSFKYTPSGTYAGTDTFTYYAHDGLESSTEPATVAIDVFPAQELTIHHGQSGPAVADHLEESVGAFTVANGNDTDGDGVWDHVDDAVIATPYGRDEVDLMQLVIHKPVPDLGGSVWLEVSDPTRVRLWEEPTKVTEVVMDMYGNVTFLTTDLPKTVWVEITSPSNQLRDVQISSNYEVYAGDTVTATGVWVYLSAVEHDTKSAAELFAPGTPWHDMTDPPRQTAEHVLGGTGLRPIVAGDPVRNAIWMRFEVAPNGAWNESGVRFDVTRRMEWAFWQVDSNQTVYAHNYFEFPDMTEEANDDSRTDDETNEPDASGYMWTHDNPRKLNGPQWDQVLDVARFNAQEFVRVRFDGTDPSGNGTDGSRCSGRLMWHCCHTLEPDGSGWWQRTTGNQEVAGVNDIGYPPGHVEIQNYDPLNP